MDQKPLDLRITAAASSTSDISSTAIDQAPRSDANDGIQKIYHNIKKPSIDKRKYRGLLLTNNLRVLLVSDPDIQLSAAGLSVQVGTFSDPKDILGLSHLCQRTLVTGSKKYPKENEFRKILSDHGGCFKGRTWSDRTEFIFDVASQYLKDTLNIFLQFSKSPLFTDSAINSEIDSINSEYEHYKNSDYCMLNQLVKSVCDQNHPFSKFNIGNKETLQTIPTAKGIDIRKELRRYHQKWYSANIMSLIVVGKETLNTLEEIVYPFSRIQDKSATAPSWPEHPFPQELRRKILYSVPIMKLRRLIVDFPLHCTRRYYKTKPVQYLCSLVNNEGPGSLLSALKRRGWCHNLRCFSSKSARGFDFFTLQINLTDEGIHHVDEIIAFIFQYIKLLKTQDSHYCFGEIQRRTMKMTFNTKEDLDPVVFVRHHIDLIQEYPMEEILCVNDLMTDWKPDVIEVISLPTPENIFIHIIAKVFEEKCTMEEYWYGTKYHIENIDEITLQK